MPIIRRDLDALGDHQTTPRLCPYCSLVFSERTEIVRCGGCARTFTEYLACAKWMAGSAHWSLDDKVSVLSLTMLRNELDALSSNASIQLATTEIPVSAVTPIRLPPHIFQSITRVQHWPPVPPPLLPDGSRTDSPVADIFDFWIVPEIESASVISVVPVPNRKAAQSGRAALQVQMTVHGIAFGTQLVFDRKLLGLAANRFFDEDYESGSLLAAVAAEASLNRFATVHDFAVSGRNPGITHKFNAAANWCHRNGRQAQTVSMYQMRADFEEFLATPRNTFAHGEPFPGDDPLRPALSALRTAVVLSSILELVISETTVAQN
jgi:hypothetical protein